MTEYERAQMEQILAWQAQAPSWGTRLLARPSGSVASAVQAMVPVEALRAALEGVNRLAEKLSDERSVLRRAKRDSLPQLRAGELELCDRLMRIEQRRGMAMAGLGGAAFGVAGAAGMVADVPALIGLALRTIHRVALCYGENLAHSEDQKLAIGVFALASANSAEEKQAAVSALQNYAPEALDEAAWRDGVERAAEREMAKEAAVFSLRNLAGKIGLNLGKRKAAGAVPVIGAMVGGSVNAWYVYDVSQVSRYVFQERWLKHRYGPEALGIRPAAVARKTD